MSPLQELEDPKDALIMYTPDVSTQQVEQIKSIIKESENPYETLKETFKDELHVTYDRFLNTFYFAKKWR